MNVIAKPRIGNGVPYFMAAASLAAFSLAAWLVGAGEGRDTRWLTLGAVSLAVLAAAIGFVVRLFGLIEQRLVEIQTDLHLTDPKPLPAGPAAPVGIDRYGLPLRPPEIAGLSSGA